MARSRTCAVCGCTEDAACHDELRGNCWWEGDRLCSHCAQPDGRRARALVAAGQLAEVVAELLLFVREGDQDTFAPFCMQPGDTTAEALRTILRIEALPGGFKRTTQPVDEDASQLIGALDRFLEGNI
jgi:hypothetical protein